MIASSLNELQFKIGNKMKLKRMLVNLLSVLFPEIIPIPQLQAIGAIIDPSSVAAAFLANALNSQSAAGGVNFLANSGTTATITGLGNALLQFTAGSATTVTIDYAYNIAAQLPQPLFVGQKFTFNIQTNASTTIATPTLSDTAVTLAGTTSVLGAAMRWYQGQLTQTTTTVGQQFTTGTTFTSLTQVGSTNAYTVALGTNTIVPTVGNLIYLNVTAGTLPSGWYPIVKQSSATSFVICAPASGTAWTATAATVGTSTVAPATYSPLMTITGLMATVTSTMSV